MDCPRRLPGGLQVGMKHPIELGQILQKRDVAGVFDDHFAVDATGHLILIQHGAAKSDARD